MQENSINWQVKKRKFIESCNTVLTFLASFIVIMAALETALPAFIFKETGFEFYDVRYFWSHVCIAFLLTYLIALIRYFLKRQKELEYLSSRDNLTALLNRNAFDDEVNAYLKRHPNAQVAFIMMDIDDFKGINDRHGHSIGDQVLVTLALNLESVLGHEAIICRNGGDEFCAFLPKDHLDRIKQLNLLDQVYTAKDEQYPFSISIGYAMYPQEALSESDALIKADRALYVVKQHDKNDCLSYQPWMDNAAKRKVKLTSRDMLANLPIAFLICTSQGDREIIFSNQNLLSLLGYASFGDLMKATGGKVMNLIYPTDRPLLEQKITADLATGQVQPFFCNLMTSDHEKKQFFYQSQLVKEPGYGQIFYVALSAMYLR